jgi:hypothetical protein
MLLIIALLIGVIPTAYANPPDPSWVAGYWDDDDFDNTVVFITGPCAIHVTVPVHARAVFVAMARVEPGTRPTARHRYYAAAFILAPLLGSFLASAPDSH